MTTTEPTVFVIDDDKAIRSAIKNLLESVGLRAEVFSTPREFLKEGHKDKPGCLVLDVRLPGASGLDFQHELAKANVEIPVIFITGHGDVPMSVQAMKAGAVDFLTKPFRDQDLLDAIQRAIGRDQARRQLETEGVDIRNRFNSLTPREREVMSLVVAGLLNKQVAAQMSTSETTAKIHRGQVMRKMQAQSLPDLVRMSERLGPLPKSISSSSD
jgi:FixJ family two-component response regulator